MKFPLFVLIGDSFLTEEKRKEIIHSLEKETGTPLPITRRRTGEIPVESILSEARTLPFLASAQVIVLTGVEEFRKDDLELWASYFKSPHPQTFFIFEAESLEKNHSFLEGAGRQEQVFWLRPETEKLVARFVGEKFKRAGKKITQEALRLLESKIGDSFLFLNSVLDQLILAAGEKLEIDRQTVEAWEENLERYEGYDLVEALASRNITRSLEILDGLLELSGQDVPSLIGLLHWQLRRSWESRKEAVYEKALEGLFYLDWQLKTGRAEGRTEIERWLVSASGRVS